MESVKLILPLEVWLDSKTKFILNLNNYRNANYYDLNKAKKKYSELVLGSLIDQGLRKHEVIGPVALEYAYFAPRAFKVDVMNPCAVIDKFTCDALTTFRFWPDDNINIIQSVSSKYGGVDRKNPRCELTIIKLGN